MPNGFCLSIGLNSIDPGHYQGSTGTLVPCENDGRDMAGLAAALGFQTKVLRTEQATSAAVPETLLDLSKRLSASDLFVMYYSGMADSCEMSAVMKTMTSSMRRCVCSTAC